MSIISGSNLNVLSLLRINDLNLEQSLRRLSSGSRINSAKDDPSGFAITQKLTSQISGLEQANRNINDGISFASVGEGRLNDINNILQSMADLALQATGTLTSDSRQMIENAYSQFTAELNRTLESSDYNGINFLTKTDNLNFQVGANVGYGNTLSFTTNDLKSSDKIANVLGGDISDATTAQQTFTNIAFAQEYITTESSRYTNLNMSLTNRLNSNQSLSDNYSSAKSRINDLDYAEESGKLTKYQVQQQIGYYVLQQVNQYQKNILSLMV